MSEELEPDFRRVISIRQPWAWLILRPDLIHTSPAREAWLGSPLRKDIENRGWMTSYRGRLWIHAGKVYDHEAEEGISAMFPEIRIPHAGEMASMMGGILGHVNLVDCVRHHASLWKQPESCGLVLSDPVNTPFEPLRGQLGIFRAGDRIIPSRPPL